jgi:hypothetical protein
VELLVALSAVLDRICPKLVNGLKIVKLKEDIMKKILVLAPLVAALVGCSSFSKDPYTKQAEAARESREKMVERSLDKAPKWMTDVPKSTGAIYAAGTSVSGDFSMADAKAQSDALGKICIAAGGTVDRQTKTYMMDTETGTTESSEMAVRSRCNNVDVTGAVVHEVKRVSEGTRYRVYVLMALPMGEANQLRRDRLNEQLTKNAEVRSREAFRELDQQNSSTR